ncbi:MAG: YdiU family protein [Gammaproteobacteria bacterium]|nr:YdiU family protein [Gammaproteobacteria bacterium]
MSYRGPLFENRFVKSLPADEISQNYGRQVHGAIYSRVSPTHVSAPSTLILSDELANQIGFSQEFRHSQDFAEVFSGNKLLPGMDPYASRYGGHQFGHWAGQLGDGRAINLGEVALKEGGSLALQLKGAGATPYSRGADGRAVLRSSVREFLCSEAMHYLGVPTTRALSLVLTGDTVIRDMFYDGNSQEEPGAIVCRVASSFTRFGHFQLCAVKGENELLERLLDYTIEVDFPHLHAHELNGTYSRQDIYLLWFDEVCRKTADMVIEWMRVGFVHGVMNTDNMSVLGLTIDYGPYGWLDNYDLNWTPNATDAEMRRYRFGQQPLIAQWNLWQLANSLLLIVDDAASLEKILVDFTGYYEQQWREMLGRKLGLRSFDSGTDEILIARLNRVLQLHETDMTIFFRTLAMFDPYLPEARFTDVVMSAFYQPEEIPSEVLTEINAWGDLYAERLRRDDMATEQRRLFMNAVNPKYVLRNYLAQQAIDHAHLGDYAMLRELYVLLQAPYAEQPESVRFAEKRPEWARHKAGCSMLSCSS